MLLAVVVGGVVLGCMATMCTLGVVASVVGLQSSAVEENSILIIDLEQEIVEREQSSAQSLLSEIGGRAMPVGIFTLTTTLEEAYDDNRIKGVMLQGSTANCSLTSMRILREAIAAFRQSGKFVYYYSELADQSAIYVASAADSVFIGPADGVEMFGLTAQNIYYKNLLDKLGIDVEVVRCGQYKSAVEPYTQTCMSEASRRQMQREVDDLWSTIREDIATSRKIDAKGIDRYVEDCLFADADLVVKAGMADKTMYRDEFIALLKRDLGVRPKDDVHSITLSDYASQLGTDSPASTAELSGDKIALIYAVGEIFDGSSTDTKDIYADDLARTIRQARRDAKTKAIVLRINSPGGSASAAEVIWREVKLAAEAKPVVVSMSDCAASGGYYFAAAASYIFADASTLTGSIGVFGLVPCAEKALEKIGISTDKVSSHAESSPTGWTRLTDKQLRYYTQSVDKIYDVFLERVAEGRKMSKADVEKVAQGRVWTGRDAQKIGLVDELGSLDDALDKAADLADLDDYDLEELPALDDSWSQFFSDFAFGIRLRLGKMLLGSAYDVVEKSSHFAPRKGLIMRMESEVDVEF